MKVPHIITKEEAMNHKQKVKHARQNRHNKRFKKGMKGPATTPHNSASSVSRLRVEAREEIKKYQIAQWWGESYRTHNYGVPH